MFLIEITVVCLNHKQLTSSYGSTFFDIVFLGVVEQIKKTLKVVCDQKRVDRSTVMISMALDVSLAEVLVLREGIRESFHSNSCMANRGFSSTVKWSVESVNIHQDESVGNDEVLNFQDVMYCDRRIEDIIRDSCEIEVFNAISNGEFSTYVESIIYSRDRSDILYYLKNIIVDGDFQGRRLNCCGATVKAYSEFVLFKDVMNGLAIDQSNVIGCDLSNIVRVGGVIWNCLLEYVMHNAQYSSKVVVVIDGLVCLDKFIIERLAELRKYGCRISIRNFGAGDSLASVISLGDVDVIQISKSLFDLSACDIDILTTTLKFAQAFSKNVVVPMYEGVSCPSVMNDCLSLWFGWSPLGSDRNFTIA